MNQFCKATIAVCLFLLTITLRAQTIMHIGASEQLFIGAKTPVSIDSLILLPGANGFVLHDNDIIKLAMPHYTFQGAYFKQVYHFSNPVTDYSGDLGIVYNKSEAKDTIINKVLMQAYTGYDWYPLTNDKRRNQKHNLIGVINLHNLSFTELLLGYENGDAASRLAPIALAPTIDASMSVSIYPNPAISIVNVQVNLNTPVKSVRLFDASGKLLMTKDGSSGNRYQFTIGLLASGFYHIVIETNNEKISKGFMKQ